MLEQTGSMFAALRRRLPFGAAASGVRTRVGLQFRGEQLALARVHVDAGAAPQLERLQCIHVELAQRAQAIRQLANMGVLRGADVRLVLSPGEYDLYQLPAPNIPDDEIREALRWQLRETLPYSPEDAQIDHTRIPEPAATDRAAASKPSVFVVAAPRATVEQLVSPFTAAGIAVSAVDVPEYCQRNLAMLQKHAVGPVGQANPLESAEPDIAMGGAHSTGCVAWLSFEADACVLTVQTGAEHRQPHELCFTRRIHIPGADGSASHGSIETDHTVSYLIERIATQVQRSLDVFERQSGQPAVVRLTVGPHRHGATLAQTLADRLALVCHLFNPAERFEPSNDHPPAHSTAWADALFALGAALRTEQGSSAAHDSLTRRLAQRWQHWSQSLRRAA